MHSLGQHGIASLNFRVFAKNSQQCNRCFLVGMLLDIGQ